MLELYPMGQLRKCWVCKILLRKSHWNGSFDIDNGVLTKLK